MKKNVLFTGMLALALAFGLVFTGCPNDSGGGGNDDPIPVNLSLPRIEDVADFTGTFVSSETEADDLVKTASTEIAGILDGVQNNAYSVSRSISRSTYSEPYEEIYDHDKTVLQGAEVTGFIQGKDTMSAADDDNPGETVGDYMETSLRIKLAIDFGNITQHNSTIKGKYTFDEDMYYKARLTSVTPPKGDLTISYDVSNGYAVSISKNGKGLKFVMTLDGKVNRKTIEIDDVESFGLENIGGLFNTYKLTLDIYDNDNVKNEDFSKTFNSYAEAAAYLGIN
ncbi:MAG: hypothetical protein LBK13_03230 [Spirochaetales bacterium]|jgi:hypothetical protein|nr:hypothetical protein [Spirochaetales bacterium]